MTLFHYRAVSVKTGEMRLGTLEGPSRVAVLDSLRRSGLMPLEAREGKGTIKPPAPSRLNAAGRKALVSAIGELAVLIGAGLPLDRALAVLADHAAHPALKAAFAEVREEVKGGGPLARALANSPLLNSPMAVALAEAGEASGRLAEALTRLAETMDRAETLRETVTSALIYPALLICVAVGVMLIMLLVVIPQFETMLSDMGGKLPLATSILLSVSRFVRDYGLVLLAALVGSVGAVRYWFRQIATRRRLERLVLQMPLIGSLIRDAETARFSRTFATLVDNGIPLVTALMIASQVIANSLMVGAVRRVAESVKEGGGLSRHFAAENVFCGLAISFMRTGEETAQLGQMLERLADVLDRNVRTKTQRLLAVMTPAITVGLGIMVAGLIGCIMTAILGMNDMVTQ
ncbi:general secretion pathway protein F [Rhizomicrobium palustre]|uniref:General secretion pathway protein F n=1 Tax=Rhizomicrobium palustre TaxID=189966 RepID=A0A846N0V1_9PROT|nr:type II secretion system F family protein [Rhizomicrobium palustre]NIK88971.1 general secretion pathway protein F [Rhizomicrobium palustre]